MDQIPESPFTQSAEQLSELLQSDPEKGLSGKEVQLRQETFGLNRLEKAKKRPLWLIFLEQFLDPVIYVLLFANIMAFLFSDWIDGVAISVVILITVLIGFVMEWQAIRSMEALRKMARVNANVLRDGKEKQVSAEELVPGDIILLEMGDVVPADARLIQHEKLAIKESILTGESEQVEKNTKPLEEETPLPERTNMLYKGTMVTRGTARAIVVAIGKQTELGKISQLTQETESERTPLQKKLTGLSKRLIALTLILVVIIAATGYAQGRELRMMLETAIALAVAAIPEGLPIVATIALARGMLKLGKKKVVIKKLESVQTLGEAGVICTDKTGTLTENEMSVKSIYYDDHLLDIPRSEEAPDLDEKTALDTIIKVGILCNNAKPEEKKGDPLEVALVEMAQHLGYDVPEVRASYAEEYELPFDTERKMMATLNKSDGHYWVCVKGALEAVIEKCDKVWQEEQPQPLEDKQHWEEKSDQLAAQGMRVLAFAYKQTDEKPPQEEMIARLTFLGIMGFMDPPRTDVAHAIEICHNAGIKVVMVTGDHPVTARKIAEDISLISPDAPDEATVNGADLIPYEELNEEQKGRLLKAVIFARVTPAQKLDLVKLYQNNNNTVGMTGDGVNDAPALKRADIGIAMGVRGTEAAKEVADVILQDDSFNAIELAIRQGRIIFENIRNFVIYLLSSNLAEIISVAVASLLALPAPLLPLQILFLNLVTDVFPALALGFGEGAEDIMDQPPKKKDEPILAAVHWRQTLLYATGISLAVLGIILYGHFQLNLPSGQINNMGFYTLIVGQLLNVFNLPGKKSSFWMNEVTRNLWVWLALLLCGILVIMSYLIPVVREVLALEPLSWSQLGLVGLFGLGSLVFSQIVKRAGNLF